MSARLLRCLLFATITLVTIPVQADWLCDFFHSIPQDTKRRNCWPQPFVCPDRQAVRAPFAIEVANGWRQPKSVRRPLFRAEHRRIDRGRAVENPLDRLRGAVATSGDLRAACAETPEETAARMNAVHTYVAQIMPQGELPSISETRISDDGSPADQVETISRKYQATMPAPRLPPRDDGSGSSSGGGGSGGGGNYNCRVK